MRYNPLRSLRRRLSNYKPYIIASEIKAVVKAHLTPPRQHIVASLQPTTTPRGHILFSWVTQAFTGLQIPYAHTSFWEARRMAEILVELGYAVDVITAADAGDFLPQKKYDLFIGHRHNFERLCLRLNTDCARVLHCDVAHWLFHDTAGSARLLALQQRRRFSLPLLRLQGPKTAIEHADCGTVLGNEFTVGTYRYAGKPLYRVPISVPALYPWPEEKQFDRCGKHFLWFGSNGFVHKGLDLALEAFAGMPEYHLTVCGPLDDELEKDFVKAFHRELYETPNIHAVGWVDDTGPEFLRIANSCVGVVNPSCSEGGGASLIICMHAGLIPVASYESSVDIEPFGFQLPDCSVETIRESVRSVACLPPETLRARARQAWEFARANHTRENFEKAYRAVASTIIETYVRKADLAEAANKEQHGSAGAVYGDSTVLRARR